MLVNPVQPENADPSILITLAGIVILAKPVQSEKAESPIEVTLPSSGITLVLQPAINLFDDVYIIQFPLL